MVVLSRVECRQTSIKLLKGCRAAVPLLTCSDYEINVVMLFLLDFKPSYKGLTSLESQVCPTLCWDFRGVHVPPDPCYPEHSSLHTPAEILYLHL